MLEVELRITSWSSRCAGAARAAERSAMVAVAPGPGGSQHEERCYCRHHDSTGQDRTRVLVPSTGTAFPLRVCRVVVWRFRLMPVVPV
jgi:hypothetical protein